MHYVEAVACRSIMIVQLIFGLARERTMPKKKIWEIEILKLFKDLRTLFKVTELTIHSNQNDQS